MRTRLASAGGDKVVRVWDGRTSGGVLTVRTPTSLVRSIAFSPDSKRIVSRHESAFQGQKHEVRSWDLETLTEITPCTDPPPPENTLTAGSPTRSSHMRVGSTSTGALPNSTASTPSSSQSPCYAPGMV